MSSTFALFDELAGYLVTERAQYEKFERETREKLRNCSNEELLGMLDKYDFRLAQVVREKMGGSGWRSYHDWKLRGMKEIPELGQLKLILQRLSTMDNNGGSLLESLRVMAMIAILQQIIRNIQGLV